MITKDAFEIYNSLPPSLLCFAKTVLNIKIIK